MALSEDKLPISMIVEANGRLVPASPYDFELLDKRYKPGQEVEVTFKARKSRKQEKFFWYKVNQIVENTDFPDAESLVASAKIQLKYVKAIKLIGHRGATPSFHFEPRSLSTFERNEFDEFTRRFWDLIATEVVPGLDVKAFLDEGKLFIDEDI
jgi:hypothetical protein